MAEKNMQEAVINIDGNTYKVPYSVAEEIIRLEVENEKNQWIPVHEGPPKENDNPHIHFYLITNGIWIERACWHSMLDIWCNQDGTPFSIAPKITHYKCPVFPDRPQQEKN